MSGLTVVTWKWHKPGYRSTFSAHAVNVLARMVDRHYPEPHEMVCVTDNAKGIDPVVRIVPMWSDHAGVPSPHGAHQPSCYRRLKAFSKEIADVFGQRFVSLDLDTVICGDMRPVWDRTEDFVIWGETDPRSFYNGSMWLMDAGARAQVWERFDPTTSPKEAYAAKKFGSDQGWISHVLGRGEKVWTTADGVYSYRKHVVNRPLPENARIVMWHGRVKPWDLKAQRIPWVKQHWH